MIMYELVALNEQTYYINCPAKIGIYVRDPEHVYLIDSGNDKDAGKKAWKLLTKNGWQLAGILNTHSHADHIGGNHYLQTQTGCKVFSGGIEGAFTRHPILEPAFLYGGDPMKALRHKFLLAQDSNVTDFSDPAFPAEVQIIPLPGHSFDMVGYRTPDGTLFLADCVSSPETLAKYAISFLYDVGAYLKTLDQVEAMEAAVFVPSHAQTTTDIRPLVQQNRAMVFAVADRLVEMCREPDSFESLLQRTFAAYNLTMNFEQYVLVGSTVRSYLSWLSDQNRLYAFFENNCLLWHAL